MEAIMRKIQQRYQRAKNEMSNWDEVQNRVISLFSNAVSIINRLQVLGECNNYGTLQNVPSIKEAVLGKQMESLEIYLYKLRDTLKEFESIVRSLEKISRDANQLVKSGSSPFTKQMGLHVGIWPSFEFCLDGLKCSSQMYQAEFALKSAIISSLTWKCSSGEIADLQRLLIDQPNIPKDEVQSILDVMFAEEIS